MIGNFEQCLALVLREEGGYVDNPHDPGGMTNHGVTKKTWESWVGHEVDEQTMRALGTLNVAPLYKKNYWVAAQCERLPAGLDLCVFDAAVNSGVSQSIKFVQRALDVVIDGILGQQSLAAIASRDLPELIEQTCEERIHFLQNLRTWPNFGNGWSARVTRVQQNALRMTE